jgi:hypothetical protein
MDYTERVTFTSIWETNATADNIQYWIDTVTIPRRRSSQIGGDLASTPPLSIDFNLHEGTCELSVIFPEQYASEEFVQPFEFHHELANEYNEYDYVYNTIMRDFPLAVDARYISQEWGYFETGPLAMPQPPPARPRSDAGAFG